MAQAQTKRSVGRPREFDEEAALESVMDAFWQKGYEATSLADLCTCTGLHKGSLYQAFGDKHQLFMRALTHYAESEFHEVMDVARKAESPLERVRAAVGKICDDAGREKGCMMINSMVELAPHDPEVKATLEKFGEQRLAAMAQMIDAAQQAGEIRAELDPVKLSRQLMITLAGAAAMVKGFLGRDEILDVIDDVITSWT